MDAGLPAVGADAGRLLSVLRGNAAFPGNHLYSEWCRIVKTVQLPARVRSLTALLMGICFAAFLPSGDRPKSGRDLSRLISTRVEFPARYAEWTRGGPGYPLRRNSRTTPPHRECQWHAS
ncbi:hypothetical protein JCM13580A_31180 [Streptomyces drozdowiczii]